MEKKLALLLLVPIFTMLFLAVPPATARASASIKLYVYCNEDYSHSSYASLQLAGHYVSVACTNSQDYVENSVTGSCFTIYGHTLFSYKGETRVSGTLNIQTGTYGVNSGDISHTTYGEDNEAYWEVETCDG